MGMQTLAPITHATVTVAYVNPPKEGKRKGSIKDSAGVYYGVWTDKLSNFEPGETYEIDYRENNGFRDVVAVKRAQPKQQQQDDRGYTVVRTADPTPKAPPNGYYRPTSPEDKASMFRCACVTAAIKSRQVALTRDALASLIQEVNAAYELAAGM